MDAEGKNKIAKYIQNRLEEDNDAEQISKKEYKELFADNKSKQAKKDSRMWVAAKDDNLVSNFDALFRV